MAEKAMETHSSPLAWKTHGQRGLVGCSPRGRYESDTTERLHFHFSLSCIGEGNGNPLQCSCLENPRDDGAWWVAIYGVSQSRTRLKWLSSSRRILNGHWVGVPCTDLKESDLKSKISHNLQMIILRLPLSIKVLETITRSYWCTNSKVRS